ncbi:MAG TPA: efflux transporter outer membrane subunit [Terracidiphilus sp.]|nr:efflux transporter outer membrane subunit [Terracidiphilus sp.]
MRRSVCLATLFLAALTSCTVGPKYKRPVATAPDKYYTETAPKSESIADLAWWEIFKDPVLQGLIQEALKNNYDVRIAATRVEEAREQANVTRSQYFPQVGYAASITGARSNLIRNDTYYAYNFNLSWELDLWGRIRRLNEQQKALFFASQEVQRGVWLSLVSDVAQAYFELRALDEQLQIAKETGQAFQETYDLFNKKLQGGDATALETSRAEAALADVVAQIPNLEQQITAKENQINLLLGRNPNPIPRGAVLSAQYDPNEVPAGLPSSLMERRPDIRQNEQQLVASNAAIGVAKANFFPVVSLTSLFGGISPQFSQLLNSGKQWSVGGGLAGPLFTGGRLKAEYKVAVAQRNEADLIYRQNVTTAFGEVSSALAAHEKLAQSVTQEERSVSAYREAVRLSTMRYVNGLSSYFEVVDAQLQLFPAQNTLVLFDLQRKVSLVNLYKALGGGWKLSDTDWMRTVVSASPATSNP